MPAPSHHLARIKQLKNKTELSYVGLVPYIGMVALSRVRWLWAAEAIGRLLQKKYSANYAVNSVLAAIFSQRWNPKGECDALMRIVRAGTNDVDFLARAGESAAYADDLISLSCVRDAAILHSPSLVAYLEGLRAYLIGDANYQAYFQESVKSFFRSEGNELPDASLKAMSVASKKYVESGRNLPGFVRQSYNVLDVYKLEEIFSAHLGPSTHTFMPDISDRTTHSPANNSDVVILVSCSYGYLSVFSDYYIRNLRRKNSNKVHFHVISDNVEQARRYLSTLATQYSNINYSIETVAGRSQTYITIARFLICREIMNLYRSDVLITDIDLNLDLNLSLIERELEIRKFDFGLCDTGYKLPWSKFAAGLSYFRFSNEAANTYLSLLSQYLVSLYANGGFFSMDQTGVLQVYENMQARRADFKMLNLKMVIDFKRLITVPNQLNRRKIECKWGQGGPQ